MKRYRNIACILIVIVSIYSCAGANGTYGKHAKFAFNEYQQWFDRLHETDESLDMVVTVRIRAWGNRKEKEKAYQASWDGEKPTWSHCPCGMARTGNPPEVWMDLKEANGQIVIPWHVLGHEVHHLINWRDDRFIDPDDVIYLEGE